MAEVHLTIKDKEEDGNKGASIALEFNPPYPKKDDGEPTYAQTLGKALAMSLTEMGAQMRTIVDEKGNVKTIPDKVI
jgi:hypothetical protein